MAYDGEAKNKDWERIRWRCRRGLLELDLILGSFLEEHLEHLSDQQIKVLNGLLDYPDNDLWDLISGRQAVADSTTAELIGLLHHQACCIVS